ncbi:HEPN domain-containing protein [archaeon]|jgi:uncharacterized protein (UPF0332 family)|nr:HEPN domain-containing protein [archaeon]
MDLGKINWCLNQKNGIRLIDPSINLSNSYLLMAEDALGVMANEKDKSIRWAIASGYYSMYYSLYSVLMRLGVKSEIHTCTISFMNGFLGDYYSNEDVAIVGKAFSLRNAVQYYVDKVLDPKDAEEVFQRAAEFFNKSKQVTGSINEDDIEKIRSKLKRLMGDNP